MQTMPGMTSKRQAGDAWGQFQDRLFGNRQQQSYGQPPSPPSQPRPSQPSVAGWPTQSQQPAKPTGGAPDLSAYRPPAMGQSPSGRPLNQGYGRQPAAPGYGGGWGPDGIRSHDFRDRDGDGVDDRDQTGPGAPSNPRNPGAAQPIQPPSQGMPYDPAKAFRDAGMPGMDREGLAPQVMTQAADGSWWGDPLQARAYDRWLNAQNPQANWPVAPSRPPSLAPGANRTQPVQSPAPAMGTPMPQLPGGAPLPPPGNAPKGRDPQEEIDRLKQMGTWDKPQNAKARERLLQKKRDYDTLPAGYFRAPDGSVHPNNIISTPDFRPTDISGSFRPANSQAPQSPARPSRGSPRPPANRAQPIPPPPQGMPYGQGPTGFPTPVQDMFSVGGFTPAPPPPRPAAPPPVEAAWYPMQAAQSGQRVAPERIGEDYGFDEGLRIDRRVQQEARRPQGIGDNRREQIAQQERDITQRLREQVFAGPRAEREAAMAAQDAEYQRRMDQRYGGPSFTQQAIGWDGSVMSPQQNMAQRDAFIQRLNDARTPVAAAAGVYNQGMAPTPPPLNRDFASMWSQAGNMVANGWTNPLIGLFG